MYLRFVRRNDRLGHAVWVQCETYERSIDGKHYMTGCIASKDGKTTVDSSFELVGAKNHDELGREQ